MAKKQAELIKFRISEDTKIRKRGKKTREKILKVATKLFAKYGFAGTSMDEIAERVGIRKASLYHHFSSKQEIYEELIERVFAEIIKIFQVSFSSGDILKDAENFISKIMNFILQNEDYVKILLRELLDENLPVKQFALEYVPKILSFGSEILERGRKEGIFKENVDPIQLSITLTGAIIIYFVFRPVIEPFIKSPFSKKAIAERVKHISDVILYGILSNRN
ncbi:MAG: TetR/AcrR family transcriptional regulator [Candidatus Calescibacterium sp.]|jgi:AcrR family transcriptional regulator|nr:TetR/AcrR family transcriptional regulator [Candidatus Calescibacterium sp.]